MKTDPLILDLMNMISIPSVNNFDLDEINQNPEKGMSDYFETRLIELGLEVHSRKVLGERKNIWGRLKGNGNGPTIMLAGHLDTVGVDGYESPFDPKIENGKIFGRGSCDMKAGLAAYLEVLRKIKERNIQLSGDLIIAGVIDEEHAMIGSIDFGINGPIIDYAIIAEPTNLKICPSHKGQILLSIEIFGKAAHSSMPENGVNAISNMGILLHKLQKYSSSLNVHNGDQMFGKPSFNVGVITGGDNACSVPDICKIDIDRRTIDGEDLQSFVCELNDICKKIQKRTPDFEYVISKPFLNIEPLTTPLDSPLMKSIKKASDEELGYNTINVFPGSTDAPNFKCQAVICGPGSLKQCHSLNEYVDIKEVKSAVNIYYSAIINLQNN